MKPDLSPIRVLLSMMALYGCLGMAGCSLDSGLTYDSIYEGIIGDEPAPSPSRAVEMAVNRDAPDERRDGISWLSAADFGGEIEYLKLYRLLLIEDADPGVRAACAAALGRHGKVDDALLLLITLRDEDPHVRWQSADALRKLHAPAAVPALLDRLDPDVESDIDTRAAAALALGQYPDRVVLSGLIETLRQPSFNVVSAAHRSLVLLTGHDAGIDPRDWIDWSATNPDPFANQKPYTYNVYQPRRDWVDQYITFWNNQYPGEQTPRGLTDAIDG